jgi:phosphatidylethanolamine/phosphatidyl-N-methylethanolamine N-methyltransferase
MVRTRITELCASMNDQLQFLRSLIARPGGIGAIAPSGPALARAMATQTDPNQPGQLLELGPGTGVVTKALIARGFAPERITAIEYDSDLAALVAQRFPNVRVIRGDAFDLDKTLGASAPFMATVSSLPLLNFPPAQRAALMIQVFERLALAAPFVQFSYGLHAPVDPPKGVTLTRAAVVLLNLPPARVWVYRKSPV